MYDQDRWERRRLERERRRAHWHSPEKHLFSGVVFVIIGFLFLLGNMGLVDLDYVVRFWPVLLIALGAFRIVEARDDFAQSSGIFWVVIGGFLLMGTLGILRLAFHQLWPVLLIGLGALMLWRSVLAKRYRESDDAGSPGPPPPLGSSGPAVSAGFTDTGTTSSTSSNSLLNATAILGASQHRINSQDFRGGEATAILGGCNIDLHSASITAPHEPVIKVFALFGGIEIRVPDDWTVVSEVESILGGFDASKAMSPKVDSKRVIIRGSVMFGGVEVKN